MDFINIIKPTHICNIACSYCYNDDERRPVMTEHVLEDTIKKTSLILGNRKFSRALYSFGMEESP